MKTLMIYGITYDHTVNYGSCLQAYALQEAIVNTTLSDCEKISYMLIPIREFKDWPAKLTLARFFLLPIIALHRTQFNSFEKKFMHFASVRTIKELTALNCNADAFVCGSDVIWNPDLNYNLDAFYLNFATKYKFSYAASFGKCEIDDQTIRKAKENLKSFDSISVRERNGLSILSRCTEKSIKIVCDPVLLIPKKEWEKHLKKNNNIEKYIFVYITHLSSNVQNYLEKLKTETGYKIIYSAYGPKQAIKFGMLQVQKPEKWLQLIHDAEYVVTNSFHATAFSVLFHKKFFTVVNGDISKGINIRMFDFLNSLGLEKRIFSKCPEIIDKSDIDYDRVDIIIDKMREDSLDYLRQNLEAAYQEKTNLKMLSND